MSGEPPDVVVLSPDETCDGCVQLKVEVALAREARRLAIASGLILKAQLAAKTAECEALQQDRTIRGEMIEELTDIRQALVTDLARERQRAEAAETINAKLCREFVPSGVTV